MAEKRYYWLKLHKDYFDNLHIKKLRKLAGGDTYMVIYLKMQLASVNNGGVLEYNGIEEDFASELALTLDEDVENVRVVLMFLESCNLIEENDRNEFLLIEATENIGSESSSAERVRKFRQRQEALQCNTNVTASNEIVTIDIEKDIREEKENNKKKKRFIPPTVEDVKAYCEERGNSIDAETFVNFYASKGWLVGKSPMKDWKACVRTWEKNEAKPNKSAKPTAFNSFEQRSYDYDGLTEALMNRG